MRVLILGIGDAFTSRHFGSSAMIQGPEGHVLIDCPDLVHRAVREAAETAGWPVAAAAADDVILTHLHGDHCNGLESLGFLRRQIRARDPHRNRPRLHTIAPVAARLWERLAPAMDGAFEGNDGSKLDDFYDVRHLTPVGEGSAVASIAGLEVRCRVTRHSVPTIGLLISDDRGTLGWSSDTPFEQAHIDWLDAADVIVHETNNGRVHTPLADLDALPAAIRAKMRLIHVTDDFDASATDIAVLRQGEVIEPRGV